MSHVYPFVKYNSNADYNKTMKDYNKTMKDFTQQELVEIIKKSRENKKITYLEEWGFCYHKKNNTTLWKDATISIGGKCEADADEQSEMSCNEIFQNLSI